jgi:hypothetical protein
MKVHAGHPAAGAGFFQESQHVAIAAPDLRRSNLAEGRRQPETPGRR